MSYELSCVSALVSRFIASRLAEAASRYGLSTADVVGALVDAIASYLPDVERVMNVYWCCDREAWRAAISALLSSGSALLDMLEPLIKALHGEGYLIPMQVAMLDKYRGIRVRLASLDPWIDFIDVEMGDGRVKAAYIFVVGTPGTVPGFNDVVGRLERLEAPGVSLQKNGEVRLVTEAEAEKLEDLKPLEDVASLYADMLREAGVEWLVAEVEHGYSPERHAELARIYYQLGGSVPDASEAAVDTLRALEEAVKMLVKRHELEDILDDARKGGWTASLLDDAVQRLTGLYPQLIAAWRKSIEISHALQENRLTGDDVRELRRRVELVLRKTGVF